MSGRPSAAGVSPWSSRERRLSDSRARPLTFDWTVLAPAPRWRGSSSHAQPLAASRSHGWVMPVNDSRAAWPKIARSQVSPARSLPGSASARRTWRAIAASRFLAGLPGTCSGAHAPDRAGLLAAQRVADRSQVHVGDLRPVTDALLDPEQRLGHHQRRQAPQAHLAALGDGRLGQLPVPLVWPGAGRDRLPPPHVVGRAVAVLAF